LVSLGDVRVVVFGERNAFDFKVKREKHEMSRINAHGRILEII
jgi:hypothetical protein